MPQLTSQQRNMLAQAAELDSGFCNPRKFKAATEIREEVADDLRRGGWNEAEIEQMMAQD